MMKNTTFTKEHYLGTWGNILQSYQWWGIDLRSSLNIIRTTNPIVPVVFDKLYKKDDAAYIPQTFSKVRKFYEKLSVLIPNEKYLYTKLVVKAFKKKNKSLETNDAFLISRVDYIIAILCFMEEFALCPLSNRKISSNDNLLTAHSDNIDIFIEHDKKTGVTLVRIVIPNEISIEYSCSVNRI